MGRKRVQLFGQNRGVEVETDATIGATIGENLFWPNGERVREDEIRGSGPGGEFPETYWRLIREIPPNVSALEHLTGAGIVAKTGDGALAVRSIESGDLITIENADGVAGNPKIGKTVLLHEELSPEPVWTINHNLGRKVTVDVFTAGGARVMSDVLLVSDNQAQVIFDNPMAGYAVIN